MFGLLLMRNGSKTTTCVLIILTVLLVFSVSPLWAATFQVNSDQDDADAFAGDDLCDTGGGDCTLRAAIEQANALPGADVINIDAGVGTIVLTANPPTIDTEMDIIGPGANLLTIDGDGTYGPLIIMTNVSSNLDLSGVTLTNSPGNPLLGYGGGVHVSTGVARLDRVAVTNCSNQDGGGIHVGSNGNLSLTNSTVSGNMASDKGGGMEIETTGAVSIINSTISGNSSTLYGGGISIWQGTVNISNSTIALNTADSDADDFGNGGGIHNLLGNVTLKSTIVAGNNDDSPGEVHPDISGDVATEGYNLIGDEAGLTWTPLATDIHPADPLLDPLADNGGPTLTQALQDGSPAIGTGSGTSIGGGAVTTDQRGQPRSALPDMGAYEVQSADMDDDGIGETVEDEIPDADGIGTGDGNGDGTADRDQAHVCSLPTNDGAHRVCITTDGPAHPLRNVSAMAVPVDAPAEATYPYGMFSFNITGVAPGGTVDIEIYTPYDTDLIGYWKKGNDGVWADVATDITDVGAVKTKITLSLTDGGAFDRDGLVNGTIVDPGGPAVAAPPAPPTPTPTIPAAGTVSNNGGCFIDRLME